MPQIPLKEKSNRQIVYPDEEGFRYTPDNSSTRRGASLPPTPTKNVKIMSRLASQNLLLNSVPRTGRQLPKPNPKQRNIKAKRLMKRTSSADYADAIDDEGDNYYLRPGAMSAVENYNEDYNYAYQSIDNLPIQSDEILPVLVAPLSDSKFIVNANYLQSKSYKEDYFYDSISQNCSKETSYDILNKASRDDELIAKREISQLVQQNTDSLESRDDELKDSFDTAVSSVNSSTQQLKTVPYFEYSATGENIVSTTIPITTHSLDVVQKNILNVSQYHGDQSRTKAIFATSQPVVTVAQVHKHSTSRTSQQRRQLKQQDSVDSTDFIQNQIAKDKTNSYIDAHDKFNVNKEAYVGTQESVESYIEETEDSVINGMYK